MSAFSPDSWNFWTLLNSPNSHIILWMIVAISIVAAVRLLDDDDDDDDGDWTHRNRYAWILRLTTIDSSWFINIIFIQNVCHLIHEPLYSVELTPSYARFWVGRISWDGEKEICCLKLDMSWFDTANSCHHFSLLFIKITTTLSIVSRPCQLPEMQSVSQFRYLLYFSFINYWRFFPKIR